MSRSPDDQNPECYGSFLMPSGDYIGIAKSWKETPQIASESAVANSQTEASEGRASPETSV